MPSDSIKQLLWYLLLGTRGGINRARIIIALNERPMNANQLAEALNVDYTTVEHHLKILKEHGLVVTQGHKYASMYFLSSTIETNYKTFMEIWEKIRRKVKRSL